MNPYYWYYNITSTTSTGYRGKYMGRKKGATNKDKLPAELALTPEERIVLLADLILEVIVKEEKTETEGSHAVAVH